MRKLTQSQFIKDAIVVHNDKYDYSKVKFVNRITEITIICPVHGEFLQTPASHRRGVGCRLCANSAKVVGVDKFIKNAVVVHNNKYNYNNTVYVKAKEGVTIICPIHGEFTQTPNAHLRGQGCPDCGRNTTNMARRMNTKQFIEKAKSTHGNKYDYSITKYVCSNTKVKIICQIHGEFEQIPTDHLSKKGCPDCAKNGFQPSKPAYLYYLKITTDTNQVLYKIGITNRTVNERFNLTDLNKIEIVKQKLYADGAEALKWETRLKRMYKEYQYKGPDILSSGNTELFTEDIIAILECK